MDNVGGVGGGKDKGIGKAATVGVSGKEAGSEGIAGNALLVCVDKNDDFTDAKVPRILIERNIKFLDLEKTPLPPPAFGCAFIPDLTPESIEAARAEAMHDLLRKRGC